jgi:hypothetical protein
MISKRTIIGLVVGSIIIAIGTYALISSFGLQSVKDNETFGVGESTSYQFNAPIHAKQNLNITGNSFQLKLVSPRGGLQIPETDYKNELSIQWIHLVDGRSEVQIQNTGNSDLDISYGFEVLTDPIQITYHIIVIIGGIIIIGFSAGFSIRKPKGF